MEQTIREYMAKRGVQALVRVVSAPDPFAGAERLVDAYGLGPLVPNTVLLGASEEAATRLRYCAMVRTFWENRRNVVIVREGEPRPPRERPRVDIWWGGLQGNGALLLILGYLLKTSLPWQDADERMKMVVPGEQAARDAQANLRRMVARTRTGVHPEVLVADRRSFSDVVRESSAAADLVFMGMAAPDTVEGGAEAYAAYYGRLHDRTAGLPTTLFVLAAEEIAFREVLLRDETVP